MSTTEHSSDLLTLVYISQSVLPRFKLPDETVRTIAEYSRLRNADAGITGALFFSGKTFVQHLEGPEGFVERLFNRISGDFRHTRIRIIGRTTRKQRLYPSWSMIYIGRSATPAARRVARLLDESTDMMTANGETMEMMLHHLVQDYLAGP